MGTDKIIMDELEKLVTKDRISRIESVLDHRTTSLTIVLENIEHKHNISAVLRTADAFGVSKIHILNEKSVLTNSDLSRGISLGTEKWVEIEVHQTKEHLVSKLKREGFRLVALLRPEINGFTESAKNNSGSSPKGQQSIPVSNLPFEENLALLFGNEVNGISDYLRDAADIHAFIPMHGFVESLNISVACAITLYASTIERAEPKRRPKPLTIVERQNYRNEWIKKSVQNIDVVLRSFSKMISHEKN